MAGEVGHIVYGARLLTYVEKSVQTPAYWVGTVFPDIRHLGVVSRQHTHPRDVSLHNLIGSSDFYTGLRVHAWVDATREQFLREQHIKETLPWHPFVPHALKLIEDELLYDHFDDWNLIERVLTTIYEEERLVVNEEADIRTWHDILQKYFAAKPTDSSRLELARAIGLSESSAQEINSVVAQLRQDSRTQQLLEKFLHHLEQLLR